MNAPLKPWGRVRRVFFAGDVGSVVTIDETNMAINWLINYGNVKAQATRELGSMAVFGVPPGGTLFYGVDSAGSVHAWRSSDLEPIDPAAEGVCEAH
jgi:hypothetical protein